MELTIEIDFKSRRLQSSKAPVLAFSGIALVGIWNIVTSFVLSFLLAVRARNIGEAETRRFLREVGRKSLTHPLSFLLPGETAAQRKRSQ